MPASLLMSNALAVERAHLSNQDEFSVAAMATNLNQLLFQFSKPGQFITAFFSVLDRNNGTLEYVNAGHEPPIMINNGQLVVYEQTADVVLGVIDDVQYQSTIINLSPGSMVCIFTDGITEAFNKSGEQFGERRLVTLLRRFGSEPARVICDRIKMELMQYRGDTLQSDDITAVVFKV